MLLSRSRTLIFSILTFYCTIVLDFHDFCFHALYVLDSLGQKHILGQDRRQYTCYTSNSPAEHTGVRVPQVFQERNVNIILKLQHLVHWNHTSPWSNLREDKLRYGWGWHKEVRFKFKGGENGEGVEDLRWAELPGCLESACPRFAWKSFSWYRTGTWTMRWKPLWDRFTVSISAASCRFHLFLLFWNQIFTCKIMEMVRIRQVQVQREKFYIICCCCFFVFCFFFYKKWTKSSLLITKMIFEIVNSINKKWNLSLPDQARRVRKIR